MIKTSTEIQQQVDRLPHHAKAYYAQILKEAAANPFTYQRALVDQVRGDMEPDLKPAAILANVALTQHIRGPVEQRLDDPVKAVERIQAQAKAAREAGETETADRLDAAVAQAAVKTIESDQRRDDAKAKHEAAMQQQKHDNVERYLAAVERERDNNMKQTLTLTPEASLTHWNEKAKPAVESRLRTTYNVTPADIASYQAEQSERDAQFKEMTA